MRRNRVLRRIHFGRRTTGAHRLQPDFVITQHPHEYFLVNLVASTRQAPRGAEGVAKL
jgi:hypothetical protein